MLPPSLHSFRRRALLTILASATLLPVGARATTRGWTGTPADNAKWNTASFWGGTVPSLSDDAWFNVASGYALVDSTVAGTGHQINVGRSTGSSLIDMTGGTLTSADEFFLGQYAGATGTLHLTGGTLTSNFNFNVGAAGAGYLLMEGGALNATGALIINRYPGAGASGEASILGGAASTGGLTINSGGHLTLDDTTLTLGGDRRSTVNGYLSSGALSTYWGALAPATVVYSTTTGKTTVSVPNGRHAGIDATPAATKGERVLTADYTGVTRLEPAPAPNIHPRIYFNNDQLPDIQDRLANTAFGQEAFRMLKDYTLLLRSGRAAYNAIPSTERIMPDGTPRIGNVGFYDTSVVYNDLVAGGTTQITADDSIHTPVLACEMAMEAFECYVSQGQSGIDTRVANLAAALDTWAVWANNQSDLTTNTWKFGSFQTAVAYDLLCSFSSFTTAQRTDVRTAIAKVMTSYFARYKNGSVSAGYYGIGWTPQAVTSNWCALDSEELIAGCAIEGETVSGVTGYDAATLDTYLKNSYAALNNFFTYGWYTDGAPWEGQGKNYTFGIHQIAWARRGFDFYGLPTIRNYGDKFLPAMLQPYGYAFTKYDVLGGSGNGTPNGSNPSIDPEKGKMFVKAGDCLGLKYMYPTDNAVDFIWRNYAYGQYKDSHGAPITFLDLRDGKFNPCGVVENEILNAVIFAKDVDSTDSWETQRAQVGALDYQDLQGGTFSSRSDNTADATQLLFHVRQDFGGHTHADRNAFGLSALGRLFVKFNTTNTSNIELQPPDYSSLVDVDGVSMKVSTQDGDKCRVPAKAAAWADNATAAFATGDATYAYTNQWAWHNYAAGTTFTPATGYVADNNCFNNFRRSNNQISESFGNTPFVSYPFWDGPNQNEGVQKKSYNPMVQVYRTAGLVRGAKPYALIIDDVVKDASTHAYRWFAAIPPDLSIVTGSSLPAGCNPATDVVLQEPSATGTRGLLVRVLRADGTPVQQATNSDGTATSGSSLAYIEKLTTVDSSHSNYYRLVIQRTGVVAPNFRVLLFPFRTGDTLPATAWNGSSLTVNIGSQADVFAFTPRTPTVAGQTVTINEFNFTRNGVSVLDYRGQVEPTSVR